jgi:uncharacterized iron-regulated membrane protein
LRVPRCAHGERQCAGSVAWHERATGRRLGVSWAVWLLCPVAFTALAAVVSWWRHRPARPPDMARAMSDHARFLEALDGAVDTLPECPPRRPR